MTIADVGELEDAVRAGVRVVCARYPDAYWRSLEDGHRYPEEFVAAMTSAGWLSILVPEEFGGGGQGLSLGCAVLEEIHAAGGNAAACHAQMYLMDLVVRHGSPTLRDRYLPEIGAGRLRLQSFAITEPDAGSDTSRIRTMARPEPDGWVINGQKIWTSRVAHSDLMLLVARTTAAEQVAKRTDGISLFLVDLREAGDAVVARPIATMTGHETNELWITDLHVPPEALVGEEGRGFAHVVGAMNAERILIAAECIGDGYWFTRRGAAYAGQREVFGRPIGANQGVQFPIARAYADVVAADLMRREAARRFDAGEPCGDVANMAKLLASEASWAAANACLDTHGGFGFAREYDVERKFRETRLYKVAPVANNLILAYIGHHVLGMPRSY